MARDSDNLAKSFETENTSGVLSRLIGEEDEFDRRALWRLGSWAVATVGAVVVAILANQSSMGMRRDQMASADLARQSQLIEQLARETQNEARRLASAVEILNGDRDRLYSRIAALERGLDSATGAISRQNTPATSPQSGASAASSTQASTNQASLTQASASPASTTAVSPNPAPAVSLAPAAAPAPAAPAVTSSTEAPATSQKPSPPPVASPVTATAAATVEKSPILASRPETSAAPASPASPSASALPAIPAATSLVSKSILAPPDPGAGALIEPSALPKTTMAAPMPEVVAAAPPTSDVVEEEPATTTPKLAVQRTEFGVDVGGANSIPGLRALWRGLLKSRSNAPLAALRPIIVIKEGHNGLGMQLRLVAGPIGDAAAAAKICAGIIANDRPCTTTVFEGQRLAMSADEPAPAPAADEKPAPGENPSAHKRYAPRRANPKDESAQKPEPSTLSQIFGRRQ